MATVIHDPGYRDLFEKHLHEVINPSWNYMGAAETWEDEVDNCVLGLVGEAGELANKVKKMWYHTRPGEDTSHYIDEIELEEGDILYYIAKLNDLLKFKLDRVLAKNKAKLESRHPELGKVETRFGEGYIK